MNAFIGGAALAGVKIASPLSEAQAFREFGNLPAIGSSRIVPRGPAGLTESTPAATTSFLDEIGYDAVFGAHTKARQAFEAAQLVVAQVKVRDLPELALKACTMFVYEDPREKHLRHIKPVIAVSVAIDLAKMSLPEGEAA